MYRELETEGTIHFAYELKPPQGPVLDPEPLRELSAWRSVLRDLQLLGQTPERYEGYAYGNISLRTSDAADGMVVTASQTSGLADVSQSDLTRISAVSFERFWVEAEGEAPPSSEALTHAMLYAADSRIRAVVHAHCPEIWQHAATLNLPATHESVGYGTPEMVKAVQELLNQHQSRPLVFVTRGHEDGVFACGHGLRDAAILLISVLARARAEELE